MHPEKQPDRTQDGSVTARYGALVAEGRIADDAAQREVAATLDALTRRLEETARPKKLFARAAAAPHGLYIWGQVGRGKSMLMELFFAHAPVEKKRRVHFHAFMQEIHARIHRLRQDGIGDPVIMLARQLAQEAMLLCFDELQAHDVTDATLLYRLFSGLFEAGVTVVSTSNRPPADLYTGGVQAERFAKFIALIEQHMQVLALPSPSDYRLLQEKSARARWFSPLGPAADAFIADALNEWGKPSRGTLHVQGRNIAFLLYGQSVGRFTFHELCETALGPADYLAIARRLTMVALTGIPRLTPEKRNEAKRFVTLIDALYECRVKLLCTAETPPDQLYTQGDGAFEFRRTVSRLIEMQSEKYNE